MRNSFFRTTKQTRALAAAAKSQAVNTNTYISRICMSSVRYAAAGG